MCLPEREKNISPTHDIKLFTGRSNPKLAGEIAKYLGTSIAPMIVKNLCSGSRKHSRRRRFCYSTIV